MGPVWAPISPSAGCFFHAGSHDAPGSESALAPRIVSGPILLTGLAHCATCKGAMTLRTGTSKSGMVHRHYTCSICARQGKVACKGRLIRMDRLDTLVVDHLQERLFQPERLTVLLGSVMAPRSERVGEVDMRVVRLQTEITDADERLKRFYQMVENGLTDLDDILKGRVGALKHDRERAKAALDRICGIRSSTMTFDPETIEQFGRLMRDSIATGAIPFRKAYLQAVIDRIEVDDDVVRIVGNTATLEQAIAGGATSSNGVRRSLSPPQPIASMTKRCMRL